jgi:benzoyl-CoA reductase/2-hydroxyglutaryl-CoA dehydratase subunit BcrC/BadD/HgdB
MDPQNPWESVALRLWSCVQNASSEVNHKRYGKMVKDWQCDGAIFFSNRSCISITGVVVDKISYLEDNFGIPSISFQAEMADPRSFAEADVLAQIDAFLELLEQKKK